MDRHKALELFDLTGKRALVTGSSQGIGSRSRKALPNMGPKSSSTAATQA
jgi:short-subunit dehydrogenase